MGLPACVLMHHQATQAYVFLTSIFPTKSELPQKSNKRTNITARTACELPEHQAYPPEPFRATSRKKADQGEETSAMRTNETSPTQKAQTQRAQQQEARKQGAPTKGARKRAPGVRPQGHRRRPTQPPQEPDAAARDQARRRRAQSLPAAGRASCHHRDGDRLQQRATMQTTGIYRPCGRHEFVTISRLANKPE